MKQLENAAKQSWWVRSAYWLVGITAHKMVDYAFDYALYPFVIYKLGLLTGGVLMAVLSLLNCLLLLAIYDYLKRDWLGIEFLKDLRHYSGASNFRRFLAWILSREALAFVCLSVRFDPFITTAYLRKGRYTGLAPRDWKIFFGSVVLSNAAWAIVCWGGVAGLKRLLNMD